MKEKYSSIPIPTKQREYTIISQSPAKYPRPHQKSAINENEEFAKYGVECS